MLRCFQIAFFVLVGISIALFALRSHLTGSTSLLWSIGGLAFAYFGLIFRTLTKDPDAFPVKFSRKTIVFLLGNSTRTALSLIASIIVLCVIGYSFLWRTMDVRIVVTPVGEPALSILHDVKFQISFMLPNEEPIIHSLEPSTELTVWFAPFQSKKSITVIALHGEFSPASHVGTLRDLSSSVIALTPKARPALVVMIHRAQEDIKRPRIFSVKAWASGKNSAAVEKELDKSGNAVFVVTKSWDWFVQVINQLEKSVHRSPSIPVDVVRKTYSINLDSPEEFRWYPLDSENPQQLKRLVLSGRDVEASMDLGGG